MDKKEPRKRIGCDLCKKNKSTFIFQQPMYRNLVLWFCEGCYEVLTGDKP